MMHPANPGHATRVGGNIINPTLPKQIEEDNHWWFASRTRAIFAVVGPYLTSRSLEILDVGCGAGNMFHHLGRYGKVVGVENHPSPVAAGQARGYDIRQGDGRDLPFPDNRFDLVSALDVIEHNEEDVTMLREIYRVLKPGGVVLVTVPALQWLWSHNDVLNAHVRRYTTSQIRDRFGQAGFEPLRTTYNNFFVFPLAAALILLRRGKETDVELHSHYFDDDAYQVDMEPTHPAINTVLTGVGWFEDDTRVQLRVHLVHRRPTE